MRMQIRETGRFQAVDDAGTKYTVVELTEFLDAGTLERPGARVAGLRSYKLLNGDHVNVAEDGTMEHVASGRQLRRA